jgi:UDP-3-O-[3-hydroxymyristoyl] N-acetylglucosamine deacetylase
MILGRQHTLGRVVTTQGIGLHTGAPISVTLRPQAESTGIVFRRTDTPVVTDVLARADHVVDTRLATVLGAGGVTISTVEHLMAALSAAGVDNALVEVDGPEVPVMDGSARAWVALVEEAGLQGQARARQVLVVRERVEVVEGDKRACWEPGLGFRVDCGIAFTHPVVGQQSVSLVVTPESFRVELAEARTFCMMRDVEAMRARGLAKGGSLANAIVLSETSVLNPEGLRWPDEFVRHKALDAVGDAFLLGGPVEGAMTLHKAGHALHLKLCLELLSRPSAFEWVRGADVEATPSRPRRRPSRAESGPPPAAA